MTDAAPPIWLPPKPGIIRPATADLLKYGSPWLGVLPFSPSVLAQKRGEALLPFAVDYIGTQNFTADTNSVTASGVSFGEAVEAPNVKYLWVACGGYSNSGRSFVSVTAGGVTMNVIANAGGGNAFSTIAILDVSALTSGDIVLTMNSVSFGGAQISWGTVINPAVAVPTSPQVATDTSNSETSVSAGVTVPARGAGIAAAMARGGGTNVAGAWGWTNASELYDEGIENSRGTLASIVTEGEITVTATANDNNDFKSLAIAVWSPADGA